MASKFSFVAALRSAALAVALVVSSPSAVLARPVVANAVAADRDDKAMPLAEQLTEARLQLQQAIRSRDRAGDGDAGQQRHARVADKQRLLDWLVDLQGEKVKRLEDLAALRGSPKAVAEDDPLVMALEKQPPYSAVKIDALRDEIDSLKENLAAAEASLRTNQTELQNLQDQLKAKAAAVRRVTDRVPEAMRNPAAKDDEEHAGLLRRATEIELSIATLDRDALNLRIASLKSRIHDLAAIVARVLPEQTLSLDDLAAQRQHVRAEQDKLTAEAAEAGKRYVRHSSQRDRLNDPHRPADGETNGQAALLTLAIKTDNAIRKGLDDLQVLTGLSGDSWERRYAVLSSADAPRRHAALAELRELRQKLGDWSNLSKTRQEVLRTEIREQRMRMGNLAPESPGRPLETQRLNLLLQQAAIAERVELAATKLERQVSRWLADFDDGRGEGFEGRSARLRDRAMDILVGIWNQELFVAEDVSEVDGRRVSVQYGITVGKSIGVVALFVLGYWMFAGLARLIQNLLVRRFKVSSQLASVIRRWTTIAFAIALVFFALNLARIPLSVFAFLGGALAIGVGFGAQTIIKNFISGLIVLLERQIRIGDIVELGGITGHVTAVDLRATTVRSFNGVEALIPNANFVENQVINWTYSNRQVRHELKIGVAYGSGMQRVEQMFLEIAAEHAHVLKTPPPEVFFEDFGDSALLVVLVYWVELDSPVGPRRVASDLRHAIHLRLAAAGIAIPFPQRDVRVVFPEPLPVRSTNERSWSFANGQ